MYIFFFLIFYYILRVAALSELHSFFFFFNQYYKLHFTTSVNLPVINMTVAFSVLSWRWWPGSPS